jgi:hypothetical protein
MVDFQKAEIIMSEMGFGQERAQMNDGWLLLNQGQEAEGEEDNRTVNVQSLKVFLSSVMNFDFPWMRRAQEEKAAADDENPEQEQKFKVDPKSIGTFEDGSLKVAYEEIQWINKHFTLL